MDIEDAFNVGDRVTLHGLRTAAHLNGRHGHIGSAGRTENGRYAVNVDLLDPSTPTVSAKPQNITRESAVISRAEGEERAGACGGCIEEKYGRPLSAILDSVRFITATHLLMADGINTLQDIEALRRTPQGMARMNHFLAMGWSCWVDRGSFITPENKSVFELVQGWAQSQLPSYLQRGDVTRNADDMQMLTVMKDAFDHKTAAKSWHVRIHGSFWIVGDDSEGTFLIPEQNMDIVYQCVGLRSNLYTMISGRFQDRPAMFTVTMIPFYGRLVYDGVVVPADGFAGMPALADSRTATKLKNKVQEAKRQGRVIQRLRQLEVEGGSDEGIPSQGGAKRVNIENQPPATAQEASLVKRFKGIRDVLPQGHPGGLWVFRRCGYTKQDNPDRRIIIMAQGYPVGAFQCARLEPTATEILQEAIKAAEQAGNKRPATLMVDDYVCFQRVKFLLAGGDLTPPTAVEYYHPPTAEETAAAMKAGPGGH